MIDPSDRRSVDAARRLALVLVALLALAGCAAPVRVEWRTETEMNTAGFNLYRGESPDGPFDVKVNDQLIPPSSDPLTGKAYTFVDNTALSGITYYYRLQEVEKDGRLNNFGPTMVRAGGLAWWHIAAMILLAAGALFVWMRGGKIVKIGPPPGGER